jgi:hypothetical protein
VPEVGYQSVALPRWSSLADESNETNPELIFPKSIETFDKMRREDAQVGSVVRAVTLPIRKAKWRLDPAGARPEVVEHISKDLGVPVKGQDEVARTRTRGRFSFDDHLRLALLSLPLGFSPFEQVYDLTSEPGVAHLAKLAWRPPRTIEDIKVARDGGLIGIKQYDVKELIGVDRLVMYVNEREGANWLGQSLLRQAYKNWLLKDRLLRIQALSAERNGMGVPVYVGSAVPEAVTDPDEVTRRQEAERDAGLTIAKDIRAGESAGASIPHGATLSMKGVDGKLPDTEGPIRYHDEQIARAVLAHFLNLGTETGSWALGSTFANFFTDSLNAVAGNIADVINQHVIEDLVDLNWGDAEPAPRLVCEPIGSEHPATAEAIKALIDAKAITPDAELEAHLRSLYGLPAHVSLAEGLDDLADAEQARFAAETVQKVYLGTDRPVLTQAEARELVRRAGANLNEVAPRVPEPEEAA